ncbi:MAG: hypothetical protein KAQ87_04345 [Candidatus Pacebacteria bacterium]|nr:hypothetical protein [Candidatus Paceibacterota bacterium]
MEKINKIILAGLAVLFLFALLLAIVIGGSDYGSFLNKEVQMTKDYMEELKDTDSDDDGLSDFDEIYVHKTNPNDNDTDKDGYVDGSEVENGYDPLMSDLLVIKDPAETEININASEYEIKGSNSFLIEKIELEITNSQSEVKRILLDDFKKGDLNWSYVLRAENDSLTEGKNLIAVLAYQENKITKKEIIINAALPEDEKVITIKVDWEKELIKIETEFEKSDKYNAYDYYLAGKVASSQYEGQNIYLEVEHSMMDIFNYYLLENKKRFYLKENNIKIEGFTDLPKTIIAPEKKYTIEGGNIKDRFFAEMEIEKKLFTDEKMGDIYLTENGCAVAELPDHTVFVYSFTVPFVNEENGLLEIIFNEGKPEPYEGDKNEEEYNYNRIAGCGSLCSYLDVMDNKKLSSPDERLKIVGEASNGDPIYEFKDINDEKLKELYNDENTTAYYSEDWKKTDGNKYSYEEFIGLRPLLYWQDPLGRWIQFKNRKFMSAAEMCKPVIYFYPEEEIKIDVQVSPNGGFTFTKPDYNQGWEVEISQDGKVKDLKTNQEYDYLYWEGIGLNYPRREEGFVIKKEDLNEFFDQKLSFLGLNEEEVGDFKEYWLKRLSDDPYYKISFLTQDEFNKIAPISFSLNPKIVIRVMMTAESLNKFKSVPEQELFAAPARSGFTVVEWGGTLLR